MATVEALQRIAETRLRVMCARNHWLFDNRVKNVESTLLKLELGRTSALNEMIDLYATMVVVQTARELDVAVDAVLELFDGEVKQRPAKPPDTFPYDDVHIHARLGSKVSPPAMSDAVRQRGFEIQVRTGLQYAWWRATHDVTYKGAVKQWASQRVAGQTRAALELLDGLLADIPKSAELQLAVDKDDRPSVPLSASWLDLWEEPQRPEDISRFCESVDSVVGAAAVEAGSVGSALSDGSHAHLVNSEQLTPAQAVFVVVDELAATGWTGALVERGRRLLVTREMISVRAELNSVPAEHRVAL